MVTRRISHPFRLISLGIPYSVLLPASQPKRSPWSWPSGYESHAHADLPFRSTLRNLQSVVQVRITANRGLLRCNAGQTAQRTHWNCHKRTPAMHWHPAARFTQSCTLARPITRKNRHNRVDTQLGSCLGSCPRWHTPIARSLVHWGAHWAQDRSAECCSTDLVAQLHLGRDAVQGCVTSLIGTPKWRFTPSSDGDTLCHSDV